MRILAIDTSTKFLCLGIYDRGKTAGLSLELGPRLSSLVTLNIDRAVKACGLTLSDIHYFGCGLGPGSFTGLRVGMATIKGLSFALKKPVVGVPSLDILAKGAQTESGNIVAAVDARRGLIYCGIYRKQAGLLKRVSPYLLLSEKEFYKKVSPGSFLLGDAIFVYKENMLKYIKHVRLLEKDQWYPKPHALIELCLQNLAAKKVSDSLHIKPVYLYPKECQVKEVTSHKAVRSEAEPPRRGVRSEAEPPRRGQGTRHKEKP